MSLLNELKETSYKNERIFCLFLLAKATRAHALIPCLWSSKSTRVELMEKMHTWLILGYFICWKGKINTVLNTQKPKTEYA